MDGHTTNTTTNTATRRRRSVRRGAVLAVVLATVLATVVVVSPAPRVAAAPEAPVASKLVPVGPVRLANTRWADCGCERIDGSTLSIDVAGHPDVPDEAIAAALTITAPPTAVPGHVRVYPSSRTRPAVSTLNTRPDRVVANSAIVPLGPDGTIMLYHRRPGDVIVDVSAVFVPVDESADGRFVPLAADRLVNTRTPEPPSGPLGPFEVLRVPLPDGVDADANALVINVTVVGQEAPGHVRVRPSGVARADTSVLNYDGSGLPVAASMIVPVGADGFEIESRAGGHVMVDALGWFTGPSAEVSVDGLFVPVDPTRVLDTRTGGERIHPSGAIEVPSPADGAGALVTNVTTTRPDRRGYVTAHPARTARSGTSTVNPSFWNHTVANFAITRVSDHGAAYYSRAGTDLLVDLTGWFTGEPVPATEPAAPNEPAGPARTLLVGDSTLTSFAFLPQTHAALVGFEPVIDVAACRRLMRRSCYSEITGIRPNTAVEAILSTPGALDIVVVKVGFNDWFSDFPAEFDAVVQAARSKGAHTIVWQTYNTVVDRPDARRAYEENNADLRVLTALPRYADVLLADWAGYSDGRRDWFWDGTHLTTAGTWAQADFISRWIAAAEHRPCPRPWAPGGPVPDPCPPPEQLGPVADPQSLY